MDSIFKQVEKNIDTLVENNVNWAECASQEDLTAARNGDLRLGFFEKQVPKDWLGDVKGKKVLCLAGAGGLQAPLFAAAGADVTVLDISEKMLEKDCMMAERKGLSIRIEKGNMCDLSRFEDESFDLIFNPPSLMYVPDVHPVFHECSRVLKPGGKLIIMAPNPVNYLCDFIEDENGGYYKAVNRMPYSSRDGEWVEFGHTMEDYIKGQLECGFIIDGYMECQREDITELYFMTRAVKTKI